MVAEKRRERILEVVRTKGFAALPELAKEMDVSESTVRRDLAHLEKEGSTKRTHGGVFYTGPSPGMIHFEQRQEDEWDKKSAVASAAVELIQDGDTILLDGGTTTYELARLLVGRPLQIVTNSLPVANLFVAESTADLIVVGGYVHSRTGVIYGRYTDDMLKMLNVRRAVLSAAGVNKRGVFNNNRLLVETEQAMLSSADEAILVVDSTKFGYQSLAHVCPIGDFDKVVTDNEITEDWRSRIIASGAELIIAEKIDNAR